MRPNDVEDAALPERGHRLRTSPPLGPAHGDGNGLRCPEVENVDRFDAEHPSVVSVRPVPWPKPRRKCGGSSQISCRSGGFLPDTSYGECTCGYNTTNTAHDVDAARVTQQVGVDAGENAHMLRQGATKTKSGVPFGMRGAARRDVGRTAEVTEGSDREPRNGCPATGCRSGGAEGRGAWTLQNSDERWVGSTTAHTPSPAAVQDRERRLRRMAATEQSSGRAPGMGHERGLRHSLAGLAAGEQCDKRRRRLRETSGAGTYIKEWMAGKGTDVRQGVADHKEGTANSSSEGEVAEATSKLQRRMDQRERRERK